MKKIEVKVNVERFELDEDARKRMNTSSPYQYQAMLDGSVHPEVKGCPLGRSFINGDRAVDDLNKRIQDESQVTLVVNEFNYRYETKEAKIKKEKETSMKTFNQTAIEDLKAMTTKQLANRYNSLLATYTFLEAKMDFSPVKKFATKKAAIQRVESVETIIVKAHNKPGPEKKKAADKKAAGKKFADEGKAKAGKKAASSKKDAAAPAPGVGKGNNRGASSTKGKPVHEAWIIRLSNNGISRIEFVALCEKAGIVKGTASANYANLDKATIVARLVKAGHEKRLKKAGIV